MATPSLSATFNFVKKYPITLCGFSVLFMPSVHRLLLYFSPLLLSTAIFIVAMMIWGPGASSEKSTTRRSKLKLVGEHNEWAFHESIEMDDDEEEEEEEGTAKADDQREEVDTNVFLKEKATMNLHREGITLAEPNLGLKLRPGELQKDHSLAGLAASGATCEAEPDPDLAKEGGDAAGTASSGANSQAEPEPDFGREESSSAGTAASQAEPDPDLQGEGVGTGATDGAQLHNSDGHVAQYEVGRASHVMGHTHDHKNELGGVPMVEKRPDYLQVCA